MKINLLALGMMFLGSTILAQTANAFQGDNNEKQTFLRAVTTGDVNKVKEMLQSDSALAQAKDKEGRSAVLLATYYGKKEVAAVLLASGIKLDIFEAAATGQTERVRELIKLDSALVAAYSPDGFFPLGLAVFFGHPDTVEVLLAAGADVNQVSKERMKVTSLQAAVASDRLGIARVLIAHGANVNPRGEEGFRPLHEAALKGSIELATLLLDNGADINVKSDDGKTPLALAVERKKTEMVAFLRKRGAIE